MKPSNHATTVGEILQLHAEALEQLRIAEEALDQAHSMLKDLNLENYIQSGPRMRSGQMTVADAHGVVANLMADLASVECPECGQDMSKNEACLSGHCPSLEGV